MYYELINYADGYKHYLIAFRTETNSTADSTQLVAHRNKYAGGKWKLTPVNGGEKFLFSIGIDEGQAKMVN